MRRDRKSTDKAQSRITAAADQIRIVRRERGRTAHGDSLLDSALRSMAVGDAGNAMIALKQFGQCPDLSNAHATVIRIACKHLRSRWPMWTSSQ